MPVIFIFNNQMIRIPERLHVISLARGAHPLAASLSMGGDENGQKG